MGLFDLFKKKQEPLFPLDLSLLKVDFHSHLLPGIDDGVDSFEESLAIIESFIELGYQKLIITPHVMADFYRNDSKTIVELTNQLISKVKEKQLNISIACSAEYYFDEHFQKLFDNDELLLFGQKHVLFELSYINEPGNIKDFIFKAKSKGLTPIMAHPERYPYWVGNTAYIQELREAGCLMQINTNSLVGHYSPDAKMMAESMIENGLVDFLCSDCHKMQHIELMKKVKLKKHLIEALSSGMIKNQIFID